jgi:hypothetical protein
MHQFKFASKLNLAIDLNQTLALCAAATIVMIS